VEAEPVLPERGVGDSAASKVEPSLQSAAVQPPLRIGVSARILHPEAAAALGFRGKTLQYLETSLAHWLMAHGALVFMVPTLEAQSSLQRASVSMRDYVKSLDGLVLQGGADVSPETYHEQPLRPEWNGDRVRDMYEVEMLWAFVFEQKPVLGICRGLQLINVALNGSLHQDIPTELPTAIRHVDTALYDTLHHDVEFQPDSLLSRLYGGDARLRVNSIHHQCIKQLGNGLVVEARSPADGVIEAVRWTGSSFVMGVQWHPEFHASHQGHLLDSGPVVSNFLHECARRRSAAGRPVRR
jgi:gamma-glutamyl-gamma-aminobutyrate hydrolase PuuD